MNLPFEINFDRVRGLLHDPLYQNSMYLAIGRFVDIGIGFFFWTIAARLYTIADVGIATAIISSLGLIMTFSRLGFDVTIIRFMPTDDHSRVFNSSLWITTVAALVGGVVYLSIIDLVSPEIAFIRDFAGTFLLFAIVNSITLTTGYALLAIRRADQKLVQNIILGSRLLLLVPLVGTGDLGIYYSYGLALTFGAIYALLIMWRHVTFSIRIDRDFVSRTFSFSSLNYLANILRDVPYLLLPIIILSLLSPKDAALYYIAYAIGNMILIIPDAISTSFFIEGSHGMNLRTGAVRSLATTYIILIPAILFIFLFGDQLLLLFGTDYGEAFDLLKIIALSSLVVTISTWFIAIQNIKLRVRGVVVLNLIRFGLILGLSYYLLPLYGVLGAGYALLIMYVILALGIAVYVKREKWI